MIATMSANTASREPTGSRFTHGIPRPPTSFLIRDILGKCGNDATSSESEEQNDAEVQKFPSSMRVCSAENCKKIELRKASSSPAPILCCRECITGSDSRNGERKKFVEFKTRDFDTPVRSKDSNPSPTNHQRNDALSRERHQSADVKSENREELKSDSTRDFCRDPVFRYSIRKESNDYSSRESRSSASPSPIPLDSAPSEVPVDFSKSAERGRSDRQRLSMAYQLHSSNGGNDLWNKRCEDQSSLSPSNPLYREEHDRLRALNKLKAASLYNQQYFYSGLYAGAHNLIDLNYAFNLRAASAFGVPQLALPFLSQYRQAQAANARSHGLTKPSQKSESNRVDSLRRDPYPRYKLLNWPRGQDFSSSKDYEIATPLKSAPATATEGSRTKPSSSLAHPPSPSYSEHSHSSPITDKRPIQLPAYFRSRLGGPVSVDESNCEGKSKKCRRSRTVFTELQMLGLEKRFEKQQYLSTPDRVELAELLGLSQLQVKTWYQNRRMKWKKQVMQGGGTEPPTKPKGRPRKIRPGEQIEGTAPMYEMGKSGDEIKALDLRAHVDPTYQANPPPS